MTARKFVSSCSDTYCDANTDAYSDTGADHAQCARLQGAGGQEAVDLSWNGATSNNIDIYRNGAPIATVPNIPGFYTDRIGARGRATYTYTVCEAGTANCSNQVTVRF